MKLYFKYFSIHLKSCLQYKISFLFTLLGQFLASFNVFLGVYFMLTRFKKVNGYRLEDCLLCFSIVILAFSIAECFFRGFDGFARIIGNGEFDRMLVRPKGLVYQVLCQRIELTRIGRIIQALVILLYSTSKINIVWTPLKVVTLILMIFGGSIVFSSLFLIYAAICFFTLEGLEFMNIFTDGAREYGKYPYDIYGKNVLKFCTYVIPFALFQYYPFLYLTGRSNQIWFTILPLVSCFFFIPCYVLFQFGIRHYKSTGS